MIALRYQKVEISKWIMEVNYEMKQLQGCDEDQLLDYNLESIKYGNSLLIAL